MLRRCKKYRLVLGDGVEKVKCFGAGLCRNRSAFVEDKKERDSMMDSQQGRAREATEAPRSDSMGIAHFYRDSTRDFVLILRPFRHDSAKTEVEND